jgi:hypothetical protein
MRRDELIILVIAAALVGCTLGETDPGGAGAVLEAPPEPGVADGVTGVLVTVTGEAGGRVDLAVTGGRFIDADDDTTTRVFLVDGQAQVNVAAATPGIATVFVVAAEISTAVDILFEPLRFAAGPAEAIAFAPGLVVHEVCVAATGGAGAVVVEVAAPDEVTPFEGAPLRAQPPTGLSCPPEADGPWRGYARLTWRSPTGEARGDLEYLGAVTAGARLDLAGVRFPGYQVAGAVVDQGSWVEVEVEVEYPAAGGLPAAPAAGVTIARTTGLHLVPSDGAPAFFGSSSGGASDDPRTDSAGRVTLYYDLQTADPGTYTLFVTPESGATHRIAEPIEVL